MGRMAESRAERRLSKEPRMETTASVTCLLLSSDSRSSAARCARVSISADAGVAGCLVLSGTEEGGGEGSGLDLGLIRGAVALPAAVWLSKRQGGG